MGSGSKFDMATLVVAYALAVGYAPGVTEAPGGYVIGTPVPQLPLGHEGAGA